MEFTDNSTQEKIWRIKFSQEDTEKNKLAESISKKLNISAIIAKLLINRGYETSEAAENFLCLKTNVFHDSFLLNDMDKAVERIFEAIDKKESIKIYGDYDVDGVTSVCTLYLYLKNLGANVSYYIPKRTEDGYGVSSNVIKDFAENGVNLIITVDTGITATEETDYAKSLGIDMIVTDHHECPAVLPSALAVINPKREDSTYPFKDLAGVGVVFKLVCACESRICQNNGTELIDGIRKVCHDYADLVSLGTVADVMPLADENRLIVSYGIKMIESTDRYGLLSLMEAATHTNKNAPKRKISTGFIGYTLAPRINAAGRMSSASLAVELLLSDSKEKADELSKELCEINTLRQTEENKIAESAYEKIESTHNFDNDTVIVVDGYGWNQGVIGIVASKVTEKYGLPAIIISFDESEEDVAYQSIGKGSGRSVKGFNLVEALNNCKDLLEKYGGHELAAGLSVKKCNVDEFRRQINEYAKNKKIEDNISLITDVDLELETTDLTINLASDLYKLEPYGTANPVPVFKLSGATVKSIMPIGAGKHTKLILEKDEISVCALYFGKAPFELNLFEKDETDILFNLDINEFRGMKSVQLIIRDIKKCKGYEDGLEYNLSRYTEICGGATFTPDENIIPEREDFAYVYKLLRTESGLGHDMISHKTMLTVLAEKNINYIKLKFALAILGEMNLIEISEDAEQSDMYKFKLSEAKEKADLEKSGILCRLRAQLVKKETE